MTLATVVSWAGDHQFPQVIAIPHPQGPQLSDLSLPLLHVLGFHLKTSLASTHPIPVPVGIGKLQPLNPLTVFVDRRHCEKALAQNTKLLS